MSCKELRRAGVLERVKSGELKLVNAAVMMGLSYRQTKRLAKRYREVGAKGLKHASAGRESNRRKPRKFRALVKKVVFVAEVLLFFGQRFSFLGESLPGKSFDSNPAVGACGVR